MVIDGVCCFGNGWWFFVGFMCECVSCLKIVDVVIVNGGVVWVGEIFM